MAIVTQQQANNQPQNDEPRVTLQETLDQLMSSLGRESDECMRIYEKRLHTQPSSAHGFLKRGRFMYRQSERARAVAERLALISEIMLALYNTNNAEINLSTLTIGDDAKALLEEVRQHATIPEVIHTAAIGTLFTELNQYAM